MHTLFFYLYLLRQLILLLHRMKINLFYGYSDCNPKDTTLEEVFQLILNDASVKERTERHRYYLNQGLEKEAGYEKSGSICFSVATLFEGGKTQKHITGWSGIGMVDIDDTDEIVIDRLEEAAKKDPHTLLTYRTISGCGLRILFLYDCKNRSLLNFQQQKELYEYAFQHANHHYSRLLGVKADPKCKTCTQLSGLAHDPNAYYHPQAETFLIDFEAYQEHKKQRTKTMKLLKKAVVAAQKRLADENIVFEEGSRNEYLMRMGYLLNAYGIPQEYAYEWAMENYQHRFDGYIYGIFESCYKHTDEFGTLRIPSASGGSGKEENRWASVQDIEQFLDSQVSLRYNVIRRQCEICWKTPVDDSNAEGTSPCPLHKGEFEPITDRDENSLWSRMKKTGVEVRQQDIHNVMHSEFVRMYHPFESYFRSLPEWDGVDYIGQLARTVHVKDDQERFVEYFRKWFVGIVPTIMDEQVVNHEIMVFIGKQGNFKSTFFSLLLPPDLREYFHVKMNSKHLSKDDMLTLCEKALVCLEEIDELRPSELNQFKALVTAKNISERAAYARNKEHRPHIASFCATGNNPHFLTDPTDNRRWLVVEVEDIDNPLENPFNYTGIYSQAVALWKSGFHYWFDQHEIRALNERNRDYEAPSPEEELLLKYYRPTFEGCQGSICLKVSEILERINGSIKQVLSPVRLGLLLKKLGFKGCKFNGERGYLVIERSIDEIQATQKRAAKELES